MSNTNDDGILEKAKEEARTLIEKARIDALEVLDKAKSAASLTLEKARVVERLVSLEDEVKGFTAQNNRIIAHLISEFGGEDPLTGGKTDGSVDDLVVKVGIQNGRIGKLENWKSYTNGGLAILGVGFCAVVVAVVDLLVKGH